MSKQYEQEQETPLSVATRDNGSTLADGADLKQVNARLQAQLEQIRRHNEVLLEMAAQEAMTADLDERLKQVTQTIARTLDVERVGVWLYNEQQTGIECIQLYEYTPDRFSSGLTLLAADYPTYFQALREEFTIDADDARRDRRTSEFAESYLEPLNITSMLDLPIQQGANVLGVVCLEHVGPQRNWSIEDKNFAAAAANQIALALERHKRIQAEQEQERARVALAQSEERFSILAENVPGVIYLCNNDARYTMAFINNQVEELTGYPAQAFLDDQVSFVEMYHPDDVPAIEEEVEAALAEQRPFFLRYRIKHRDGDWRWVEEIGSGVYDEAGELLFLEGILNDITRRLNREEALRRSQELVQSVVKNAPMIIFAADKEGIFTLSDGKQLASVGLEPGQVVGLSAFDVYKDVPEIVAHLEQTLTGLPSQYEVDMAGTVFETWLEPIRGENNQVEGLVGVSMDVTERTQVRQTLETRLRYERGLSLASRVLVAAEETAVPQTLEYLREAANACRAYFFEIFNDPLDGLCGRRLYEACAPGIIPQIDDPDLQRFPFAAFGFGRWIDLLSQGKPINNLISEMPESEQTFLAVQEIESILVLPVIINGKLQGMIGFDDTREATHWQDEDIQLLQAATGMVGAYIERQQAGRMLQARVGYEHGLALASQTLLTATTADALSEALNYLREATNTSRAYFFENFVDEELGLCQRQLYEACASGVAPQIDSPELQRMPYEESGLGRWVEVMSSGQLINTAAADLPSPEDEIVGSFGIDAILLLPVFVKDRWHGYIGFDKVGEAVAWSHEDARLLQTAARLFGAYLERTQLYGEIESSLDLREAQVRVSTLAAREIAGMPDLNQLYERIVTLIKEEFGYYHVQLLRYDPALDNVGLVVGYGEIGTKMLAMNHSMPMGVGVIGKAAAEGRSVLLEDVREDPNWKPNSLLPDTRSELAVPIKAGDEVLGVIDVQSNRLGGLTPADQLLLDGLCGQLAIAIESTRLRQDMEDRLRELNSLQRFMSRSGWDTYQGGQLRTPGYLFNRGDVQPLSDQSHHLLLPQQPAIPGARQETAVLNDNEPAATNSLLAARIQPLAVRGETIGRLVVEADEERPLTADEATFLQAVSGQVAEALEAARLFEQTQSALAEQERLSSELATVAQVSTAASTILEAEALLQAAVDLAQTSFNLSHAHIYLYNKENKVLVLQAGAGDAGRLMTLEGRTINLDAISLVARAARDRQGALANNVQKELEFIPHPMLADIRSELAMPMIVGGSLIGVLDLLSDQADRFSEQDMGIFNTLASQVAVAVQNAQLYAEQVATAEDLRKVDLLKSEFLASMSHELRTPLNSIIGFADVLLEGIDGELNERMEQDVRLIRDSGSHLRALIGDILDMSKIEAGMMEIRHEAMEISQLAQDVVATAMPLAQEKNLYLNLEIAKDIPVIYADHTRIRQVLWNIVGNAIKFTQEGGVTIAVSQVQEKDLLVRVSDTGVGIRRSDLPVVFEQFRQVGGELNTSSSGGTGLGLPISKKLVELHGGEIWVDSKVGVGTTLFFTLPVGLPSARVTAKPKTGPLPFLS
jgi:PAS domain S-box-containing protein